MPGEAHVETGLRPVLASENCSRLQAAHGPQALRPRIDRAEFERSSKRAGGCTQIAAFVAFLSDQEMIEAVDRLVRSAASRSSFGRTISARAGQAGRPPQGEKPWWRAQAGRFVKPPQGLLRESARPLPGSRAAHSSPRRLPPVRRHPDSRTHHRVPRNQLTPGRRIEPVRPRASAPHSVLVGCQIQPVELDVVELAWSISSRNSEADRDDCARPASRRIRAA